MNRSPDGQIRCAVVLADAQAAGAAPPGVDGRSYALAMCEDVIELVGDLSIVTPAVMCLDRGDPTWIADVAALSWPGTPISETQDQAPGAAVLAALTMAGEQGADAAAVVAGDVPDLPGLLLGKLFRALGGHEVAVSASGGGGLVALACRLPPPAWLTAELADLGSETLTDDRRVAVGPGWHRLRQPADVHRLDPGLEGWASTRALLSAPTPG